MRPTLRTPTLIFCILFGPAVFLWIQFREMTFLNWYLAFMPFAWIALFALWHLIFGKEDFKKRSRFAASLAITYLILWIGAKFLLRYEGSTSGSSFPKFSWVWQDEVPGNPTPIQLAEPGEIDSELREAAGEARDFLGPNRSGMWEDLPFSTDWEKNPPQLVWRRPVGKAWSSFVVSDGKAITQEQVGDEERITCLDLFTGREIWHHADPGVRLLLVRAENEGAAMGGDGPRATPVIAGDRVFSVGATGIVNCLDLGTGRSLWQTDLVESFDISIPRWGFSNSPLILGDSQSIVLGGGDIEGPTLICLNQIDGTPLWIYDGEGSSYGSPRLLTIHGTEQIVSINRKSVTGLTPDSGELLWKFEWSGHYPKVGQPILYRENRLLVTASYGAGSYLLQIKKKDRAWTVAELWKSTRMKTKFSSAAIVGDYAYGLDEGRLACIDLETGNRVWKDQKYGFGQNLLFKDWLLIQTESGRVVLGQANPEGLEEKNSIDALSSMTWNIPAIAGRFLIVRNDREAACFLLPPHSDKP